MDAAATGELNRRRTSVDLVDMTNAVARRGPLQRQAVYRDGHSRKSRFLIGVAAGMSQHGGSLKLGLSALTFRRGSGQASGRNLCSIGLVMGIYICI